MSRGGIARRKVRYVYEDTGYKADASVAAFKKLTSQNPVHLYYGDSTAFSKAINPELNRLESILMTGASFATEINDPEKYPYQFMVGPDYQGMFALLLKYIAREKPSAKVAFVYSDTGLKGILMTAIPRIAPPPFGVRTRLNSVAPWRQPLIVSTGKGGGLA